MNKLPSLISAVLLTLPGSLFAADGAGPSSAPVKDGASQSAAVPAGDEFEAIARQKVQTVPGMEPNRAPKLPDILLAWDAQPAAGFTPGEKITTQAQLDAELQRWRERFAPFMQDLAPALPPVRRQTELESFEWRLIASEMKMDDKGNLSPLPNVVPVEGENPWRAVAIPHYTGPINRAEAHYRKELQLDDAMLAADRLFLHFNGVDYIAEVFLNGQKVGDHTGLFGAFEFDLKPFAKPGKNLLEIKVFNDSPLMGDFFFTGPGRKFGKKLVACGSPGWNEPGLAKGWHMCAPGFGIWQRCYLETRPATFIHDLFVRPLPDFSGAEVRVELPEGTKGAEVSYSLYGQNFPATLAKDHVPAALMAAAPGAPGFRQFTFTVPIPKEKLRLWSLDEPWLYQLQIKVNQDGKTVDAAKRQFGMRSFVQSATSTPKGRFYLNGKEIKLRGANMMGNIMQCVIRKDFNQLRDDILLAKIANMTYWRMTQQPCQPEVYEYFDQLGLLAQTDFPTFNGIRKDVVDTAKPQFEEMIRLVRSHPCNALVSYLNEPDFNKPMMLNRKGHEDLFTGFDATAERLNPGQVTKWVDGDYVNLSHRYSDHHVYDTWYGNGIRSTYLGNWHATRAGWMHGCGEFGAEGLDSIPLMKKYYLPQWLEPAKDGTWSPNRIPRCQTADTGRKWQDLTTRTLEDWVDSSRRHQLWGTRLFTESLRRDPKMNSFAIHLLIDAWPAGWLKSIMDCDRQAKPAYFAYRDALTPLAINLRPDAFYGFSGETLKTGVWICNDTPESPAGTSLRYQFEMDGKILQTGTAKTTIAASSPEFQGWIPVAIPDVPRRTQATLRAGLFARDGRLLHDSAVEFELFPAADKGKPLHRPGGQAQKLISQ